MTHKASSINPNHIFVDTNVLVGGYSGDARFQKDADCLRYLYSLTGKRFYISSLGVTQLISVYQKKKSNEEITRVVRELQHRFNVIDFTNRDIDSALVETGADIETTCSMCWHGSKSSALSLRTTLRITACSSMSALSSPNA